jgi:phage tail-like protein
MRAAVAGLPNPHPLVARLPAVFLDDDSPAPAGNGRHPAPPVPAGSFTQRFVSAFDEVLAPVFATLDCFDAYLDPGLAPDDFVAWLADWVALDLDDGWTLAQRRELVRQAARLHRWRGTRRGLEEQVRLVVDGEVEVDDSGGTAWSTAPGGQVPGTAPASVRVTVRVADPQAVDRRRLQDAVARAVPAHVTAMVEVNRA